MIDAHGVQGAKMTVRFHIRQISSSHFYITRHEFQEGKWNSSFVSVHQRSSKDDCLDIVARMNGIACCHVRASGQGSPKMRDFLREKINRIGS
jgi:hypothetical protein